MINRDVVTAKMTIVERSLGRIAEVCESSRNDLLPIDVGEIATLNLQRAIQATIGLATHVVAAESYSIPDSTAELFALLAEREVIDPGLARGLQSTLSLRHRIIYEYETVDPAILESILERHLGDLRALGSQVIDFFGLSGT